MLTTKAVFQRKTNDFAPRNCEIEKVIRLTGVEYDQFARNMLRDQEFIKESAGLMRVDTNEISHCLLVTGEGRQDGILVRSEGSEYARYAAFMPNAADFLQAQSLSPVLSNFIKRTGKLAAAIENAVNDAVQNGLHDRVTDEYILKLDDIAENLDLAQEEESLFSTLAVELLREHPDIKGLEFSGDKIFVTFNKPFESNGQTSEHITTENYKKLCELAPEFMNGSEAYAAFISPHDPTRLIELSVGNESESNVIMTQTVQSGGHSPITDIDMELKINKDDETARTVSFRREGLVEPQTVLTENGYNHKMEAECNLFLSDWLDDIKQSGFELKEFEQHNCMDMDAPY